MTDMAAPRPTLQHPSTCNTVRVHACFAGDRSKITGLQWSQNVWRALHLMAGERVLTIGIFRSIRFPD